MEHYSAPEHRAAAAAAPAEDRSELVTLNVGGDIFTTTVSTLCKERGSMLDVMFSGVFPVTRDPLGRIFIDRCGLRFRHILNYLRSGTVHVGVSTDTADAGLRQQLLEEADFFGLAGLSAALRDVMPADEPQTPDDTSSTDNADAMAMHVIRTVIRQAQKTGTSASLPQQLPPDDFDDPMPASLSQESMVSEAPLGNRDYDYTFSIDEDF